ncbi:MAG TPA: hypothetical protein DD706_18720 [Nitrospiraceae bacterium]|nr:hypothetical protein [Nitrospiraceae bacterium]
MEYPGLSTTQAMGSPRLSASFLHFFLAPVLCAFSGFHTASYLFVGLYTWPRTSRVIVLTIGMLIFSYEFIYKNQASRPTPTWKYSSFESAFYTCVLPYAIGAGALWALAGLSK